MPRSCWSGSADWPPERRRCWIGRRRSAGFARKSMKVRILESARRDLRAGYKFYEHQEHGIGEYFLNSLFADIDSLTLYGGIHALKFGFHSMLASRFPYAVYYRL